MRPAAWALGDLRLRCPMPDARKARVVQVLVAEVDRRLSVFFVSNVDGTRHAPQVGVSRIQSVEGGCLNSSSSTCTCQTHLSRLCACDVMFVVLDVGRNAPLK